MAKIVLSLLFLLSFPVFSYAQDMEIKLPTPKEKGDVSLEETIKKRRSERNLSDKALTLEEIGQLLWACQGITNRQYGFRAAPSASATYPLDIYLASTDGLFYYIPETHSLRRIKTKDIRPALSQACLGQSFVRDAAVNIIICAEFERTTSRYGKRGENYVYIEVGHVAENVHLQAVALGLGSVPVGAFSDDSVKEVLGISEEIMPIYIIPVGHIKD